MQYLDEQIEAIRTHLPAALHAFDATAIHQSRVATRRLKAGFDILEPLLADLDAGPLGKAGKNLRRRLGPLRDLDVMIGHLSEPGLPPRLAAAVEWIRQQFETQRTDARAANDLGPKKAAKLSDRFGDWFRIRRGLDAHADAVTPLLTDALHNRFAAFAELADIVSGLAQPPVDAPPVDVHELRIDGKDVRYAFELAAAHGLPVPKKVAKVFKSMQDALGDWHDEVVLAE
ncbi:MAG TPA: CHAD domain-containing protein, partial [Tepidisphaeraceae bacterium]